MATAEATETETSTEFDDATKELGDQLVGLTLLQAKAVTDYLKEIHGIEPASGGAVVMAGPATAGDDDGGPAEQTEFDVVLTSFGDQKIGVIKAVRAMTALGLKEAKAMVEGVPSKIKEGIEKEEAEKLKKELEDSGASVEIK